MRQGRFIDSFIYALSGILTAIKEERNMRFHLCTAFYVFLFSLFYDFSKAEYGLLAVMICGVLALELVNSSLERTVERPSPERYLTAGAVKDMAAGAVLIFSIGCAIGGVLLFWDVPTLKAIGLFFIQNPICIVLLLASLLCAYFFIFKEKRTNR